MPHRSNRTLVLCFDGTSNEFDDTNTNIVKLCAALQMEDRDQQMVYYQPGIGTWTAPGIHGGIQRWIAKTADLAVAWYLSGHVMGGYKFLMENHLPGDRICIFGFSRGAYTARALAGMLHCVGLLPRGNDEQVPFAYRMYKRYKNDPNLSKKFKNTFCKSVEIEFLGVWDTVASVGVLLPKSLPFVSNDTIKTFRHAVSLDERRIKFGVTLWNPEDEVTKEEPEQSSSKINKGASVEEMWFSGGHCDVGGGNVTDDTHPNVANIPFRWMLSEVVKAKCGILFNNDQLDALRIPHECVPRANLASIPKNNRLATDLTAVGDDEPSSSKIHDKAISSWKEADRIDAGAEHHDALWQIPLWWLLQIPAWTGKRMDWTGQRIFPKDDIRQDRSSIHWTVLERVKGQKGYKPRAELPSDWQEYVDDSTVGDASK